MMGVTPKQLRSFQFIAAYINRTGYAPSLAEIARGAQLGSKSVASRIVDSLCERGWIRKLDHRARSIEIVATQHPAVTQAVSLRPEIRREAESFAKLHGISIETAINEACRAYFERAA